MRKVRKYLLFVLASISSFVHAQTSSNWKMKDWVDPITDLPGSSATLSGTLPGSSLVVKCDGAGTPVVSIQVLIRTYLGADDGTPVTFRFAKTEPITTRRWEYVRQGTFNRDYKEVRKLLSELEKSEFINVRLTRYDAQPVDLTFLSTGAANEFTHVLETCGYAT